MAELNETDFEARYNHASTGLFKDNTVNEIEEADLRDLVTYIKDSALFAKSDRYTIFQQFTTTTSTTAYVGTSSPAITAYATGQVFQVKAHATSTGSVTLNLNTLGAKKVYTDPSTQATTGDVVINTIYFLIYDSALDSATGGFIMIGSGGGGDVTKVGTPVNNQIGVWTGDGTIEGDADLVFDGSNLGIGQASPTARLHIAAGSTAASSAPIKFTSGSLMTTAEAGGVEFLTDKAYFTITTGAARKEFTLNDTALTSGRVAYTTTNGRLLSSANLTFNGSDFQFDGTSANIFATGSINIGSDTMAVSGDTSMSISSPIILINETNNGFIQLGDTLTPLFGIDQYISDDGLGGGGTRWFMFGSEGYWEVYQDNSGQSLLFHGDDQGLRYGGDYSANYVDRTLADWGTVKGAKTFTGKQTFANPGTTAASFNLPVSAAPSSPVDGDVWREDNTNTGLKIRINGVTKTITVS